MSITGLPWQRACLVTRHPEVSKSSDLEGVVITKMSKEFHAAPPGNKLSFEAGPGLPRRAIFERSVHGYRRGNDGPTRVGVTGPTSVGADRRPSAANAAAR